MSEEEKEIKKTVNGLKDFLDGITNISKEKSADKMFEELGYKKIDDVCSVDRYRKDFDLKGARHIIFSIDKEVSVAEEDTDGYALNRDYFSMEELQAINEKCKELGWL